MPSQAPDLHPRALLKDMVEGLVETPAQFARPFLSMKMADGDVLAVRGTTGELQLQIMSHTSKEQFREALSRMLNVWDSAPLWLWQLEALLSNQSVAIAQQESKNVPKERSSGV